ncbi:hypothetical protein PG997_014125 [Apiospora hydei]|uniref:Uncharacterized protein n=1 Tax=Apiospora hydei TaxID=1337664 RepID=A0ABR1V858_9PEZI
MSDDPNPRVSNGTCYTAANKRLDSSFIPCGNDAFGHQTCCGKGDNCLADGACFGVHGDGDPGEYGHMLTYWAGCSDPEYEDASCPKKVVDQPWVALTYCDNDDGEWAICSQSGDPSTLQPGAYCSCTDTAKATVAFKDTKTLTNLVSLPQNTGDSMSFFPGYSLSKTVPTTAGGGQATKTSPAETMTSRTLEEKTSSVAPPPPLSPPAGTNTTPSSSTSSPSLSSSSGLPSSSGSSSATTFTDANGRTVTATVTRTATSPSDTNASGSNTGNGDGSSSSSESSGLNTGAKIGVGVGMAVGGVLLVALVFLLLRRRRNNSPSSKRSRMEEDGAYMPPNEPKVPMAGGAAILEADGRPAKPHKLRGELGEGTAAAAGGGGGRRPSTKLKSAHRPRPSDDSAISELEGSLGGAGVGAGTTGVGHGITAAPPGEELATVAELPGTDAQGRRLASDDSLVPAPLQVHHGGQGGQGAPSSTTAPGAAGAGTHAGSQGNSAAIDEGAQVKPWGARWRRT